MNFWRKLKKLKKPVMVLAPMADVTDAAFRRIIAKYGKPDVLWTEFVSADGLFLGGYDHLIHDLKFTEAERPIVAQFFTSKPEMMKKAAELAVELDFDGVDINMGCPDKSVEKQGGGAAMMKDPKLAQEIILAAKAGAGNLPVSVKTRIGYNSFDIKWIKVLLEVKPAVLTVHLRTRKEMSKVPAHWELMKRIVELRNEVSPNTLIFGNGNVKDLEEAKHKVLETGCDGVMLGRAIFGNPWLFSGHVPTTQEKLKVLVEHTKLYQELLPHKSFAIMKKHFKAYINGWSDAKELRMKLMETQNASEVKAIICDYLKKC